MAHKDNTKNAENAAKGSAAAEIVEEVVAAPVVVKTGHHTGVVQTFPAVAKPA